MCDTFVAVPDSTRHGETILAKNSDREPNEAQNITFIPAAVHPPGSMLKCTLIEIPQVETTYAVVLSRPFWMWGAEMGVNEHGVAIGNEAVFTKEPYAKTGLLGMDILRLALERGGTAEEALNVITGLLEEFGQGGSGGYKKNLYYHNSFIIADPGGAFVLETAGKHWTAKRVEHAASISNALTIQSEYSMASPGLSGYAEKKGYIKKGGELRFADAFSDSLYTRFSGGRTRQSCTAGFLKTRQGSIESSDMAAMLRDHNTPGIYRPGSRPMKGICLHAGGLVSAQSTGAMVAVLRDKLPPLVCFTGTSGTCVSMFKPMILEKGELRGYENRFTRIMADGSIEVYGRAEGKPAAGALTPDSLWWQSEYIHRRVLMNYPALAPEWITQRDRLEKEYLRKIESLWREGKTDEAVKYALKCNEEFTSRALTLPDEMDKLLKKAGPASPLWFRVYWKMANRSAGLKL